MNKPIDMDQIFMLMAYFMAGASRCISRQVGVIIVKNNMVIASGTNNTPGDTTRCADLFPHGMTPEFPRAKHHEFSNDHEVHAEMKALLGLIKNGGGHDLRNATLYSTLKPCPNCMKHIAETDIKRIVYAEDYDLGGYGEHMTRIINQSNITMIHKPVSDTDFILGTSMEINRVYQDYMNQQKQK